MAAGDSPGRALRRPSIVNGHPHVSPASGRWLMPPADSTPGRARTWIDAQHGQQVRGHTEAEQVFGRLAAGEVGTPVFRGCHGLEGTALVSARHEAGWPAWRRIGAWVRLPRTGACPPARTS